MNTPLYQEMFNTYVENYNADNEWLTDEELVEKIWRIGPSLKIAQQELIQSIKNCRGGVRTELESRGYLLIPFMENGIKAKAWKIAKSEDGNYIEKEFLRRTKRHDSSGLSIMRGVEAAEKSKLLPKEERTKYLPK